MQKLDTLTVEKPCIDAADEGYNVEWSTELTLEQAYDEYLKAWFVLHALHSLMGADPAGPGTLFNMSVGYDMPGITTEKMDRFINRLTNSENEPLFARYHEELAALAADERLLAGTPWRERLPRLRELPGRIPSRMCTSVTLSTMHGCPPGEIESICAYMLEKKRSRHPGEAQPDPARIRCGAGDPERSGLWLHRLEAGGLQQGPPVLGCRADADPAPCPGKEAGQAFRGKAFQHPRRGNTKGVLPGAEMYMSGRALYPLTMSLASRLTGEFKGALPLSFSGGVSAWNLAEVLEAGIRPVTLATELLKPGGYGRLKELAEKSERLSDAWDMTLVDAARSARAAASAVRAPYAAKDFHGSQKVHVEGPLPIFDCFIAPCVHTCPIHQDVPEYIHLAGQGRYEEAFAAIYRRNPLPFMTGYLCDHQCTENCTRIDWEGAVRIREIKRIAAEKGYEAFRASATLPARRAPQRGLKAAIVGAGPPAWRRPRFLPAKASRRISTRGKPMPVASCATSCLPSASRTARWKRTSPCCATWGWSSISPRNARLKSRS